MFKSRKAFVVIGLIGIALFLLKFGKTKNQAAKDMFATTFPGFAVSNYDAASFRKVKATDSEAICFLLTPMGKFPQVPDGFIDGIIDPINYVGPQTFVLACSPVTATNEVRNEIAQIAKEVSKDADPVFFGQASEKAAGYKVTLKNSLQDIDAVLFFVEGGLRFQVFSKQGMLDANVVDDVAAQLKRLWPTDPLIAKHHLKEIKRQKTKEIRRKQKKRLAGAAASKIIRADPRLRQLLKEGYIRLATQKDADQWVKRSKNKPSNLTMHAIRHALRDRSAFVVMKFIDLPPKLGTVSEKPLFFLEEGAGAGGMEHHTVFLANGSCKNCGE